MSNLKAFFVLFIIVVVSVLLAIPVVRFYNQYYPLEYGGNVALLAGYLLCFYFFSGMTYGYFTGWYKTFLLAVFLSSFAYFLWFVLGDSHGWIFLILGIAGYIIGFLIRKGVGYLRSPKPTV